MKRKENLDISDVSRGYAEVVETAPNGSWVEIEAVEFTKKGNIKRQLRLRLDIFSAANIACRVHSAITAQEQHAKRLRTMAGGA